MIVVCGEALIDVIGDRRVAGGGPFNTARALARLGVPTSFLSHLSTDASGAELARLLRADGVGLELATFGPEPTTVAVAGVRGDGTAEYEFVVDGTAAPNLTAGMVPDDLGPEVDGVHVGTLGLALEPMASTLAGLVQRERGRRLVMVDPNVRTGVCPDGAYRLRLRQAMAAGTIVKASAADLAWVYPSLEVEEAADAILREGVRLVVVTLGASGAIGVHRDFRVSVLAPQVDVVDTIGAGDAFGAGLLAWLHDHRRVRPDLELAESELRAALDFSCRVAAVTCTRPGAEPPRRSEVLTE